MKKRILWVDDEIELLRSHIFFLTEKGYEVETVTNGEDAVSEVKDKSFDLIFLDEMMAGLGGLQTLAEIKEINPNIPVVMITKSEEETLMHDAIGGKITDYLIKPVHPSQVLLVCKKVLEAKQISGEYVAKDYLLDFNEISRTVMSGPDWEEWIDIYLKLVNWELELDAHPEVGLRQTLTDQKKECNQEFSRFIEKNYLKWINAKSSFDVPPFSPSITNDYVLCHLEE
ncbi:MAG: response regulator, partial [Bacteroidota bacterium]|nr:response regulator [Bacteroidota bacterium]